MKVLIADDEETSRILLTETLQDWGYEVQGAKDGLEAWKFAQAEDAPRLVILDWMMPGIDGTELCRKMRESMLSQYVYIILLTSKNEKQDIVLGMDSGADAFLTKPVDLMELRSRLAAGKRILTHQNLLSQKLAKRSTAIQAIKMSDAERIEIPESILSSATNLSRDSLLAFAPRQLVNGRALPTLGKIVLLSKLGAGGMGTVYRGYSPKLKTEVAVKVLAVQQMEAAARFYREAQIAAMVNSKHLVSVFDVDQENGLIYMVMELVHGRPAVECLKDSIRTQRCGLAEAVALDICIATAEGLAAAHESGIVHRDVKPDNILLPFNQDGSSLDFGAAKLADLGIARLEKGADALTQTNFAMGTAGFMAPEQVCDAKSAGKPADVFGLGATLYVMLAAHAAFVGTSTFAVMANTVN